MAAMNILELSCCHMYLVIILGSTARSSDAGAKAVHVMVALHVLCA